MFYNLEARFCSTSVPVLAWNNAWRASGTIRYQVEWESYDCFPESNCDHIYQTAYTSSPWSASCCKVQIQRLFMPLLYYTVFQHNLNFCGLNFSSDWNETWYTFSTLSGQVHIVGTFRSDIIFSIVPNLTICILPYSSSEPCGLNSLVFIQLNRDLT